MPMLLAILSENLFKCWFIKRDRLRQFLTWHYATPLRINKDQLIENSVLIDIKIRNLHRDADRRRK